MVRFGPVEAAVVVEEAGRAGAQFRPRRRARHGRSRTATSPRRCSWMERHDVEYRVLACAGPAGAGGGRRVAVAASLPAASTGPPKLLRDGSPPRFLPPPGIDIYERVDPWEDEGFGDPLAESLGLRQLGGDLLPRPARHLRLALLLRRRRRRALAYVAMHIHEGIAVLALASCLVGERDGLGQSAVLHRCIADAAAAGCETMAVAEAGCDRRSPTGRACCGPVLRTLFAPSPGSPAPGLHDLNSGACVTLLGRLHRKT